MKRRDFIVLVGASAGSTYAAMTTRIAQHHVTLDYCKELGVPIEVFNNLNGSAYYYEGVGPTILVGRRGR